MIKHVDNRIRINSSHQVLYISAFDDDEPKSFSINVAYPIVNANTNNNKVANLIENKKLTILFIIVILFLQNYNFVFEYINNIIFNK